MPPSEARVRAPATVSPRGAERRGSPLFLRVVQLAGDQPAYSLVLGFWRSQLTSDGLLVVRPRDRALRPVAVSAPAGHSYVDEWFAYSGQNVGPLRPVADSQEGGMPDQSTVLYLYAEAPLHAGVGLPTDAAIDLPIQREQATDYPIVRASSLKGALRAHAATRRPTEEVASAFGPPPKAPEADRFAGALVLGDALTLVFPFRFGVASTRADQAAAARGATWLRLALRDVGVGAKTAAGYGYWIEVESGKGEWTAPPAQPTE